MKQNTILIVLIIANLLCVFYQIQLGMVDIVDYLKLIINSAAVLMCSLSLWKRL